MLAKIWVKYQGLNVAMGRKKESGYNSRDEWLRLPVAAITMELVKAQA